MSTTGEALRVRRSLTDLQDEYVAGEKKPLEELMRAWKGIKESSFFVLGGYHGEPFRGAGWGDSTFWGGYCHRRTERHCQGRQTAQWRAGDGQRFAGVGRAGHRGFGGARHDGSEPGLSY